MSSAQVEFVLRRAAQNHLKLDKKKREALKKDPKKIDGVDVERILHQYQSDFLVIHDDLYQTAAAMVYLLPYVDTELLPDEERIAEVLAALNEERMEAQQERQKLEAEIDANAELSERKKADQK